jgi:hypothetical protein
MTKTGSEVENDLFNLIAASDLATTITGTIYKSGMRPINAKSEDAVVSFMTGLDSQIQTGALTINVYVQDIDNGAGTLVKNTARCRQIETTLNQIIQETKPSEYRWSLGATIQTFPADEIGQHFVNAKVKFQLATF